MHACVVRCFNMHRSEKLKMKALNISIQDSHRLEANYYGQTPRTT